jgi:hypothetical protein
MRTAQEGERAGGLTRGGHFGDKSPVNRLRRTPRAAAIRIAFVLMTAVSLPNATASEGRDSKSPAAAEVEDAIPEGGSLTGREIYERFLENKFRESYQELHVESRDPGGNSQTTRFAISLQDHRDEQGNPDKGVNAKMLVEVSDPFDMRHTAYLMIAKEPGPDDEFAYRPSSRRVQRVDLKNTSLLGTDYTFNDIAFQNIEDADYNRHPDEVIDGIVVYVVEANVKETIDVEYHKTMSYLEKEHYIPLRTRYWDDHGVEVKEMQAPAAKIRAFGDSWVATESTMKDLRQQTSSSLYVDDFDTAPKFHRKIFTVSHLNKGH